MKTTKFFDNKIDHAAEEAVKEFAHLSKKKRVEFVNEITKTGLKPMPNTSLAGYFDSAKAAYAALIDAISGKGTWESNPLVFCYTFKLAK